MISSELLETIKEDLIKHEGYKQEIYLCSEGIPTFGIGHAVKEYDVEWTWPVGTFVEKERIDNAFQQDLDDACSDCAALFLQFASLPDQVKRVLVNMAFNLGRTRLGKFKKMIGAVNEGRWSKAADQMMDSRWYGQVGRRSVELVEMMRKA